MRTSPHLLMASTLEQFRQVRFLLASRQRTGHQIRLVRAAAMFATVAGEILFNQGAFGPASRWYTTAIHAAVDAGDRYMADIALAGLAYLPTYSGKPSDVLALLDKRLSQQTPNTPAIAWLWGMAARAHASLNQGDGFQHAIARARETLGKAPSESLRPGIFSFLPEKLEFYEANGCAQLGKAQQATAAAKAALAIYDPAETTEPALVQLDLATALVHDGEIDEGCQVADQAITRPGTYFGVTVLRRANEFNSMLGHEKTRSVQDWRHSLGTLHRNASAGARV